MRFRVLLAALPLFGYVTFAATSGTDLNTAAAGSELQSASGADVHIAPRSSSTVYADHVVLNEGSLQIRNFSGYPVNVRQLEVAAEDAHTQAVVRVRSDTIEIASLGGGLSVKEAGAMLTRVTAGTRISFQRSNSSPSGFKRHTNHHTLYWIIGGVAVAALVIGLTAVAQGKSL